MLKAPMSLLTHLHIIDAQNAFLQDYGLGINPKYQDMPFYLGNPKLHKPVPETRFICSSATSSMKPHSVWANRLLNAFLPELDTAFWVVYRNVGIEAAWVARSWILRNTASFIPLIEVRNLQYAPYAPERPKIAARDFARLYTNNPHDDMLTNIMQLIRTVFMLDSHKDHAGIKIREKKHALWLTAGQMPVDALHRSGKGEGGAYVIFDLDMIEHWLSFLLQNMFVHFGGRLRRQDIGTPMGTNCACNLANFYLTAYELRFIVNLMHVHLDQSQPFWLRVLAAHILKAFALSGRFIDDLATVNNPYLEHLVYEDQTFHHPLIRGIYPRALELTITMEGTSVNYMDITIGPVHGRPNRLVTTLFERTVPPLSALTIIRFPHIPSHISDLAKYGIVVSQFHRFCSILMRRSNLIHSIVDVVHALYMKGYDVPRMVALVKKQCKKHRELYGTLPRHLFMAFEFALQAKFRQLA